MMLHVMASPKLRAAYSAAVFVVCSAGYLMVLWLGVAIDVAACDDITQDGGLDCSQFCGCCGGLSQLCPTLDATARAGLDPEESVSASVFGSLWITWTAC